MKEKNKVREHWEIPQLSFAVFAIISAFTTAQGMSETFFDGSSMIGFAVAIGIQLLLVWLNKETPQLVSNRNWKHCLLVGILYMITILWSTGFSFVYVCNHVYSAVYMRDDQAYLTELYQDSVEDIKRLSEKDMEKTLSEISRLISTMKAESIKNMEEDSGEVTLSVANLKLYFVNNYAVMNVIEKCNESSNRLGDVENDLKILADAILELEACEKEKHDEIEAIGAEIKTLEKENELLAKEQYDYKAETGIDKELKEQIERRRKEIERKQSEITEREQGLDEFKRVKDELKAMESYLTSRTTDLDSVLSNNLNEILKLLGQTNKDDINKAYEHADEMYSELCDLAIGEDAESAYETLLSNYFNLKSNLKVLENIFDVKNDCALEDYSVFQETEQYVSIYPTENEKRSWMETWNTGMRKIKSNFYKLPSIESGEEESNYEEILNAQRDVLMEINGIERAIYYLCGRENTLAWLSLFLAFYLDASAVIFMFIRDERRNKVE